MDDIQDYWLSNVQQTVMQVFRDRKIPMTVGVIANQFGEDDTLLNWMNDALADPTWDFEIADHGWDHEDFTTFTYDEQFSLLQQAIAKIKSTLPSVSNLQSFIPPYNAFNNDTLTALKSLGFSYMSSQLELDSAPYPLQGQNFYRFPEGAQTDLEDTGLDYSIGVSANATMKQVSTQLSLYGYAVSKYNKIIKILLVMLHPMEYSNVVDGEYPDEATINQTMYQELLNLIDLVKKANLKVVTLNKINTAVAPVTTGAVVTTGSTTGVGPIVTTESTTGAAPIVTTGSTSTTGIIVTTGSTTGADPIVTTGSTTSFAPIVTTGSTTSTTGTIATGYTTGIGTTGTTGTDPIVTTGVKVGTTGTTGANENDPVTTTGTLLITTGTTGIKDETTTSTTDAPVSTSTTGTEQVTTASSISGGGNPDSINEVNSSNLVKFSVVLIGFLFIIIL